MEACPVDAIFAEDQLPEEWQRFTRLNAAYYIQRPGGRRPGVAPAAPAWPGMNGGEGLTGGVVSSSEAGERQLLGLRRAQRAPGFLVGDVDEHVPGLTAQ
jgi:hypothetical protein